MNKNLFIFISLISVLFLAQIACSLPGSSEAQVEGPQPINAPEESEGSAASDVTEIEGTPAVTQVHSQQPGQGNNQPGQGNNQPGQGNNQPEGNNQPGGNQQPQVGPPCQDGFKANSNITNGQVFEPDEVFQVTWTLENTGDCTWDTGYVLKMRGGDIIIAESELAVSSTVNPGGTVTLSVDMQAPSTPGNYVSVWKMTDGQGHAFGLDSPQNSPLKVAIRVIPSSNSSNPTPEANPDVSVSGNGQTLLDGQCFDLNSGQEVNCNDSAADVMYQFNPVTSGKFHSQNNTSLGNNRDDEPDKAICEAETYPALAHPALEDKYFCFQINNVITTIYGWMRVERFDQDGVTFDFMTFTVDMPEAQPINPGMLFVENQGDQVTMLTDECFDVQNGQLNQQCSGIFSGFKFEETSKRNITVMQINPLEITFAAAVSAEPNKSDCESAAYNQSPIWPISQTDYYCYTFTSGIHTYYGWLRPTQFDSNGITFDYLTWQAMP